MSTQELSSIWDKVDYALADVSEQQSAEVKPADPAEWKDYWRWRRPLLDVIAVVFWAYAGLKLFVADVDRDLLGELADYRFFIFLGGALLLVALLRKRWWTTLAGFLYIVGFPLVLLFWKAPKLLVKSRSTVAFLAAVNAATLIVGNLKHMIVTSAIAAFAALAIAVSHTPFVLFIAGSAIAGLLVWSILRTIWMSVTPSRFLTLQQSAIRRSSRSQWIAQLTSPSEDLRRADIEKFDQEQQNQFVQALSMGVTAHRALYYWAYQLDRYRRSPAPFFFNIGAYAWLVVKTVAAVSLLNLATYNADPDEYVFAEAPSFLVFVRFSIAALYGGEIQALAAAGDLASAVSITTFVVGFVIVGSLIVSSALSFRASRDEREVRETIAEMQREADRLDERLTHEWEVPVREAIERLRQLRSGLIGVITFLSTRIPRDFEYGERESSGARTEK